MHFYQFHIGDYATHTKHLTLFEDLAYRRLLDLYYTGEKALPLDVQQVARLIGMREHADEVSNVLTDFFSMTEVGFISKRCDEEIAKYHAKADRARAANTKRWRESVPALKSDQKSEQKAEKKLKPKFDPLQLIAETGLPSGKWTEWLEYRRSRKLSLAEPTMRKQAAFLTGWAQKGFSAAEIIDRSIRNGWQGLFDPEGQQTKGVAKKFDPVAFVNQRPQQPQGGNDEQVITGECKRLA